MYFYDDLRAECYGVVIAASFGLSRMHVWEEDGVPDVGGTSPGLPGDRCAAAECNPSLTTLATGFSWRLLGYVPVRIVEMRWLARRPVR
jgi:hypothetical protein